MTNKIQIADKDVKTKKLETIAWYLNIMDELISG